MCLVLKMQTPKLSFIGHKRKLGGSFWVLIPAPIAKLLSLDTYEFTVEQIVEKVEEKKPLDTLDKKEFPVETQK